MSHPEPLGPANRTPISVGEVWENPITKERAMEPVKQLNPVAMERAVITLERAFASDPMFTWMFPDPHQRSRSLRVFLRVPLQYGLRYGHVTESSGGMAVSKATAS